MVLNGANPIGVIAKSNGNARHVGVNFEGNFSSFSGYLHAIVFGTDEGESIIRLSFLQNDDTLCGILHIVSHSDGYGSHAFLLLIVPLGFYPERCVVVVADGEPAHFVLDYEGGQRRRHFDGNQIGHLVFNDECGL